MRSDRRLRSPTLLGALKRRTQPYGWVLLVAPREIIVSVLTEKRDNRLRLTENNRKVWRNPIQNSHRPMAKLSYRKHNITGNPWAVRNWNMWRNPIQSRHRSMAKLNSHKHQYLQQTQGGSNTKSSNILSRLSVKYSCILCSSFFGTSSERFMAGYPLFLEF